MKGEIVLVIEGNTATTENTINYIEQVDKFIKQGYSRKDAIKEVSKIFGISKNKLYNTYKEK